MDQTAVGENSKTKVPYVLKGYKQSYMLYWKLNPVYVCSMLGSSKSTSPPFRIFTRGKQFNSMPSHYKQLSDYWGQMLPKYNHLKQIPVDD
jgi:hypothetical protein